MATLILVDAQNLDKHGHWRPMHGPSPLLDGAKDYVLAVAAPLHWWRSEVTFRDNTAWLNEPNVEVLTVPHGPEAADVQLERSLTRAVHAPGEFASVVLRTEDLGLRAWFRAWARHAGWKLETGSSRFRLAARRGRGRALTRTLKGSPGPASFGLDDLTQSVRVGACEADPELWAEVAPSPDSWRPRALQRSGGAMTAPAPPVSNRGEIIGASRENLPGVVLAVTSGLTRRFWAKLPSEDLLGKTLVASGWRVEDRALRCVQPASRTVQVECRDKVQVVRAPEVPPSWWWSYPSRKKGTKAEDVHSAWLKPRVRVTYNGIPPRVSVRPQRLGQEVVARAAASAPSCAPPGWRVPLPQIFATEADWFLVLAESDREGTDWVHVQDVDYVDVGPRSGLTLGAWTELQRLPLFVSGTYARSVLESDVRKAGVE